MVENAKQDLDNVTIQSDVKIEVIWEDKLLLHFPKEL